MITQARIDGEIAPAGSLDHGVTCAGHPGTRGSRTLQMSLFDQRDWRPSLPDYPGERLISAAIRSRRERARKREDLWPDRKHLAIIAAAVRRARKPLRGEAAIALKFAVVNRHKISNTSPLIGESSFAFHRKAAPIAAETALDGIYVVRTSLPRERSPTRLPSAPTKSRPGRARVPLLEDRRHPSASDLPLDSAARARPRLPVHARYHVEHPCAQARPHALRRDRSRGRRRHAPSIVAKAERSDAARRKQTTGRPTTDCRSTLRSLLADLATYAAPARTALNEKYVFPSTPGQPVRAAPSNSSPSTRIVAVIAAPSINECEINALSF